MSENNYGAILGVTTLVLLPVLLLTSNNIFELFVLFIYLFCWMVMIISSLMEKKESEDTMKDKMQEILIKKITDKLVTQMESEFKKIELEFKKMEKYINKLEGRIEVLEKCA